MQGHPTREGRPVGKKTAGVKWDSQHRLGGKVRKAVGVTLNL